MGRRVKERGSRNKHGRTGEKSELSNQKDGKQETGRSEKMSRLKSHVKYLTVNQLAGKNV